MNTVKSFIGKLLCVFLGHEKSHDMTTYSISVYPTYIEVKIYDINICPRCDYIHIELVYLYEEYNWNSTRIAKEAEDKLRKQGLVTLAEAYKELQNYEG